MKFRELLEAEEKKDGKSNITIDTILSDLEGIHKDQNRFVKFLNNINRPGQQPERTFTYGGDGTSEGKGGKSISYTIDSNSNQPSDEFRQIMAKIKDGHQKTWKEEIEKCLDKLDNAKRQGYIRTYFIPKLEDPGAKLTSRASKYNDDRVAGVDEYEKFGQAMVFYSSKCVSKLADADTKIGTDKIKLIMQGCFGAAPGGRREDDDYLTQFMTLEPKMKIDAAKNVINSIRSAGTNDIEGIKKDDEGEMMGDSYYSGLNYIMNMLFEADESDDKEKNKNTNIVCPKSIDEFSKNINTALKQAKAVAEKYPKQYKLWYEKLRSAFEKGVEDYQEMERDPELAKKGIRNPITNEIEHRNGKAWGAGGPAAFIRNHEDLKAITDKIRQGTPGVEGVGGWDIFNFGPKLILTMIDALEKGGKIYQRICDDISEGMKQMKKSLVNMKSEDFDKLIKKYAEEDQHQEAMAISFAAVITGLANLYKVLANGKIGQINEKTATFNSENNGSETVIQTRIDDLKNSLAKLMKEKPDYDKWLEEQNKKKEEQKKKLEAEIKQAESAPTENSSYVPKFSIKNLIKEAEEEAEKSETNRQKEIEAKKKQLEKIDSEHKKKVNVNVKNYIAILDNYKQVMSLQPEIKNLYEYIRLLFNADYAEEEYSKHFNNKDQKSSGEDISSQEEKTESLSIKMNKYRIFENETVDDLEELDGEGESEGSSSSSSSNNDGKKDSKEGEVQYSSNEGNTNWINDGSGKSLRELYKLFAEDNSSIQVNISQFKELAEAKNPKEETTRIVNIFKTLFDSLQNFDIKPIKDGVVALSKVDMNEMKSKQAAIEIVEFKKEGDEEGEKKDEKKGKTPAEHRDNLIKLINENSNIMKNVVKQLNPIYQHAENDSWLETYEKLKQELDKSGAEIRDYLFEIYPNGKAHDYIDSEIKKMNGYTFLTKTWAVISLTKEVAKILNNLAQKKESIDLNSHSMLVEANNKKGIVAQDRSPQGFINSVKSETLDLNNAMLPADYKADVYDIRNPKTFNDIETRLAERIIGTRTGTNSTGLLNLANHVIFPDDVENEEYNEVGKTLVKNGCEKLVGVIQYGSKGKDLKGKDRDCYLFLGAIWGIAHTIAKKIKGDTLKQDDTEHNGNVGKQDATQHNTDLSQENPTKNDSVIIPEISPDMLMNEIYKYIKGN